MSPAEWSKTTSVCFWQSEQKASDIGSGRVHRRSLEPQVDRKATSLLPLLLLLLLLLLPLFFSVRFQSFGAMGEQGDNEGERSWSLYRGVDRDDHPGFVGRRRCLDTRIRQLQPVIWIMRIFYQYFPISLFSLYPFSNVNGAMAARRWTPLELPFSTRDMADTFRARRSPFLGLIS